MPRKLCHDGPENGEVFLSDGDGVNNRHPQPLSLLGRVSGNYFSFREEIQMKVAGGPPRMIDIAIVQSGLGSMGLWCAITGRLVPQVGGVGSADAQ